MRNNEVPTLILGALQLFLDCPELFYYPIGLFVLLQHTVTYPFIVKTDNGLHLITLLAPHFLLVIIFQYPNNNLSILISDKVYVDFWIGDQYCFLTPGAYLNPVLQDNSIKLWQHRSIKKIMLFFIITVLHNICYLSFLSRPE